MRVADSDPTMGGLTASPALQYRRLNFTPEQERPVIGDPIVRLCGVLRRGLICESVTSRVGVSNVSQPRVEAFGGWNTKLVHVE